jgi:hypothetical protein
VVGGVWAHDTIIAATTDSVQAAAGQLEHNGQRHQLDVQNKHGLQPMQQSVKLTMFHQVHQVHQAEPGASGNSGQVMFTCQIHCLLTY